jgi:hypothetical protein
VTFLDETPEELARFDMAADAELDWRAEAAGEEYEQDLKDLIAREVNARLDTALGTA